MPPHRPTQYKSFQVAFHPPLSPKSTLSLLNSSSTIQTNNHLPTLHHDPQILSLQSLNLARKGALVHHCILSCHSADVIRETKSPSDLGNSKKRYTRLRLRTWFNQSPNPSLARKSHRTQFRVLTFKYCLRCLCSTNYQLHASNHRLQSPQRLHIITLTKCGGHSVPVPFRSTSLQPKELARRRQEASITGLQSNVPHILTEQASIKTGGPGRD